MSPRPPKLRTETGRIDRAAVIARAKKLYAAAKAEAGPDANAGELWVEAVRQAHREAASEAAVSVALRSEREQRRATG